MGAVELPKVPRPPCERYSDNGTSHCLHSPNNPVPLSRPWAIRGRMRVLQALDDRSRSGARGSISFFQLNTLAHEGNNRTGRVKGFSRPGMRRKMHAEDFLSPLPCPKREREKEDGAAKWSNACAKDYPSPQPSPTWGEGERGLWAIWFTTAALKCRCREEGGVVSAWTSYKIFS